MEDDRPMMEKKNETRKLRKVGKKPFNLIVDIVTSSLSNHSENF